MIPEPALILISRVRYGLWMGSAILEHLGNPGSFALAKTVLREAFSKPFPTPAPMARARGELHHRVAVGPDAGVRPADVHGLPG